MALRTRARRVVVVGVLVAAAACRTSGPRPLAFATDQCAHCHMTLIDPRFAGELVTLPGKSIPFDDVGCLAAYVADTTAREGRIGSLWVADFARPGSMLDAHQAVFLRSNSLHTPMDYHIVAFRSGAEADSVRVTLGGEVLSWDQVVGAVGAHSQP